jgi:hypothetical protein
MAISNITKVKAQVIQVFISQFTGEPAVLIERENSIKIVLNERQKETIRNFIEKQMNVKQKPDIEIDVIGVLMPLIIKKIWPFFVGEAGLILIALKKIGKMK